MGQPTTNAQRSVSRRIGVLVAVTVTMLLALGGSGAAVPPPPSHPSNHDITRQRQTVDQRAQQVGRLANQLSSAETTLNELQGKVELKREQANKALVDLQTARNAATRAQQRAHAAQQEVAIADARVRKERADLDSFASSAYQQGSTPGSISAYVGAKNPQDVLERNSLLNAVSGAKLNAMDAMQRARVEKANKESAARAALSLAQRKQQAAARANQAADEAKQDAIAAARDQQAQTQQVQARKQQLEAQLNAAQAKMGDLTAARKKYDAWQAQKQAEAEQAQQQAAEQAQQQATENSAESGGAQPPSESSVTEGGTSGEGGSVEAAPESSPSDSSSAGVTQSDSSPSDSTSSSTSSDSSANSSSVASSSDESSAVQAVIDRAKSALGTRYSWGGGNANGPTLGVHDGGIADYYGDYMHPGFDCSGLMVYAFAAAGVSLPHYSGYQYDAGTHVPLSQMRPGDMVFYGNAGIHHVALYIGNGEMIEAPESGMTVRITPVRYDDILPYATRVL